MLADQHFGDVVQEVAVIEEAVLDGACDFGVDVIRPLIDLDLHGVISEPKPTWVFAWVGSNYIA